MMGTLQTWVAGKKTILVAISGVIGAIIGWSGGAIDAPTAIATIWAAVLVICSRLGTKKAQDAAAAAVPPDQAKAMIAQAVGQVLDNPPPQ